LRFACVFSHSIHQPIFDINSIDNFHIYIVNIETFEFFMATHERVQISCMKHVLLNIKAVDNSIEISVKNKFFDSPTSRNVLRDVVTERFLSKISDIEELVFISVTIKNISN
jgi:hypothetical protein